jgi:eukaryotic-like serine/threonine-protein kinase
MRVILTVIAGPHKGLEFAFDRHDTFLVGRSKHAHFQLLTKDKYFSRIHFMLEVNPPQCRLIDMGSRNGTYVNGAEIFSADLKDGDQIRAGHTVLRVQVKGVSHAPVPPPIVSVHTGSARADNALPQISGYVLERDLGRGAMGMTYLGRGLGDPMPLAIKVVKPSFQGSPTQIDDFLRAARALTTLNHAHIIRLREVGVCPAGIYFVSDFVPGLDVAEHLRRHGPLSVKRAVRWTKQLTRALQYAHEGHFIHRDIKPTNVIVTEVDGTEAVMLGDYATARVYQAAPFSGLSVTTAMLHNVSFLPPEVLFNYQEINPLADQYSLAAVLYHLLTAAPVLDAPKEERKRYSSLLRRQHVPLTERRNDVPTALAAVIDRALSRTPSQRFASMAEFREAMVGAVKGES